MHRYNVNIKDKQWEDLREMAFREDKSISEIIRNAIDDVLNPGKVGLNVSEYDRRD